MNVEVLPGCCGLREITALSRHESPENAIKSLIDPRRGAFASLADRPFVIFTEAVSATYPGGRRYGLQLARYIKEKKLGTVMKSGFKINPGSGNKLRMFVWTPDYTALRALRNSQR